MDQKIAISTELPEIDAAPGTERNNRAHVSSKLGIVGIVLTAGVLALAANAVITALTTPDFMVDDVTDDPFVGTGLACVLPIIVGLIGSVYGIAALRVLSVRGERRVAVRGLALGILSVLLPIAVGVVVGNLDAATAACGGG
jgi:hypothetical protein